MPALRLSRLSVRQRQGQAGPGLRRKSRGEIRMDKIFQILGVGWIGLSVACGLVELVLRIAGDESWLPSRGIGRGHTGCIQDLP